jgi:hypothetical protein
MERFIRVRAVGEGEAAISCARPAVHNGSRFYGRDAKGAILPEGERVAWSMHMYDLIAQGQLELLPDESATPPAASKRATKLEST